MPNGNHNSQQVLGNHNPQQGLGNALFSSLPPTGPWNNSASGGFANTRPVSTPRGVSAWGVLMETTRTEADRLQIQGTHSEVPAWAPRPSLPRPTLIPGARLHTGTQPPMLPNHAISQATHHREANPMPPSARRMGSRDFSQVLRP